MNYLTYKHTKKSKEKLKKKGTKKRERTKSNKSKTHLINRNITIRNQKGGALNEEYRGTYYYLLKVFTDTKYNTDNEGNNDAFFSAILKELLSLLVDNVEKLLKNDKDKTRYVKKYNKIVPIFEYIRDSIIIFSSDDMIMTIPIYNLFSLQLGIVLTEISKVNDTSVNKVDTSMLNYSERIGVKLYNYYDKMLNCIMENKSIDDFKEIVKRTEFKGIIGKILNRGGYKREDDVKIKEYSFEDKDNNEICLLCYLGVMSLEELIESFIYCNYLVGVPDVIDHADGDLLTPFEFIHHDIIHMYNIVFIPHKLKKFYETKIKTKKTVDKKKYYKLLLMMFLIIHEIPSTVPEFEQFGISKEISMPYIFSGFLLNVGNWLDKTYFYELLPPEYRTDKERDLINTKIIDELRNIQFYDDLNKMFKTKKYNKSLEKLIKNIINYLENSFKLFIDEWFQFIEETENKKTENKQRLIYYY